MFLLSSELVCIIHDSAMQTQSRSITLQSHQDGPGLCFCTEFGESVRSKTQLALIQQVHSSEKGPGITLV